MRAAYLAGQAVLTACWWLALAWSDAVRRRFELDPSRPDVLGAFLLADAVVVAGGSVVAAVGFARGRPWARPAAAVAAGGAAYATLYLVAWIALGGDGWFGIAPMAAATALTAAIAVRRP